MDQDVSQFDDFDLDAEEYKKAGSNCLNVPPSAVKKGKGYLWPETVIIRKIEIDEWKGNENSEPGDVTFAIKSQLEVAPQSQQDGEPSLNIGNRIFTTDRFNLTAKRDRPGSGHAKMTNMSMPYIKGLAKALDIDSDSFGGNAAKFVLLHAQDILGQTIKVVVRQFENGDRGYEDEVRAVLPIEED